MSTKEKQYKDRVLIYRLYEFLKPYKIYVLCTLLLSFGAAYLGAYRPKLTQVAADDYISNKDVDGLISIIGILLIVIVGEFILTILTTYSTQWIGENTLHRIRLKVYDKLTSLSKRFFDKTSLGKILTRNISDIEVLHEVLSSGIVNFVSDIVRIVFIVFFMLNINWRLALISFLILPMLFYVTYMFKKRFRDVSKKLRKVISQFNGFTQERINAMLIVRLFNRYHFEQRNYRKINATHCETYIKTIFYQSLFWPIIEFIATFASAIMIWYGGVRYLMNEVTFGVLLAFIQYLRQFFLPIQGLSEKFNILQSALAASERVFELLDMPIEIRDPLKPLPLPKLKGNIEFKNVSFSYGKQQDIVLDDVNFSVKPGQLAAFVGATGAGKTTIINLILRFYDVSKGEILLDGINIKALSQKDLVSCFGLVMQENILFNTTVYDNVIMGNANITQKRVWDLIYEIGAETIFERFKDGINTMVHKQGTNFSMGERQLICLMRVLLYNPKILILDEATASIDNETEYLVYQVMNRVMKERTSIVIAHRLATVNHADVIFVLHKGKICEQGTHKTLLNVKNGIYQRLYKLQFQNDFSSTLSL